MKKKIFSFFLIFLLLVSLLPLGTVSFADGESFEKHGVKHSPDESNFISTTVFDANGEILHDGKNTIMQLDPGYGAVMISDEIKYINGIHTSPGKSFTSMSTFKQASLTIASSLPVVGRWVEYGSTIWNWVSAVLSDVGSGQGRDVVFRAQYADRYFYHWGYVWNGSRWVYSGASESKYWYSIIDMTYLDQQRQGVEYVFYDFSRAKERPQKISRAKNYNNKSQLRTLFRNAFNSNGLYVESYTHNW